MVGAGSPETASRDTRCANLCEKFRRKRHLQFRSAQGEAVELRCVRVCAPISKVSGPRYRGSNPCLPANPKRLPRNALRRPPRSGPGRARGRLLQAVCKPFPRNPGGSPRRRTAFRPRRNGTRASAGLPAPRRPGADPTRPRPWPRRILAPSGFPTPEPGRLAPAPFRGRGAGEPARIPTRTGLLGEPHQSDNAGMRRAAGRRPGSLIGAARLFNVRTQTWQPGSFLHSKPSFRMSVLSFLRLRQHLPGRVLVLSPIRRCCYNNR